jgi:hypothetical protein
MMRPISFLQPATLAFALAMTGWQASASLAAEAAAGPELAHFPVQRRAIETDLAAGERYRELSRFDRAQVIDSLDRIDAITRDRQSIAELSADERAELFNQQDLINTLLTKAAEDSRMVCTRSRPVGSNMIATTCKTVAERRQLRDESQKAMYTGQKAHPLPRCGPQGGAC